jgi:hypothetical protein
MARPAAESPILPDEDLASGGLPADFSSPPQLLASDDTPGPRNRLAKLGEADRVLRVRSTVFPPGQDGVVTVELDAQGNENALGFSLIFDPTRLSYVSSTGGIANATLIVNRSQVAAGRLGVVLALPTLQTLPAGTRALVDLTFRAVVEDTSTEIRFGDQPVPREVASASASELICRYVSGTVTIPRLPAPTRPALSLITTDDQASEPGLDAGSFLISRTGDLTAGLTVSLQLSGSSRNGVDYAAIAESLTFPPGVGSLVLSVSVLDDQEVEGTETVILTLLASPLYDLAEPASGTVMIADDDVLPGPTPPRILIQPMDRTAIEGDTVEFTVTAEGDAPLDYQWLFHDTNLPGAIQPRLTLPGVQLTQGGLYAVRVRNAAGTITSSSARLTIHPKPPPNTPPVISPIDDQRVKRGVESVTLAFTIQDQETAASALAVSASSSNSALVPAAGLVLSGTEAQRALEVRFAPGAEGVTTITLRVVDAAGAEATAQFRITVSQENTPPVISPIDDQRVKRGVESVTLAFTIQDQEAAASALAVSASSSNSALVPAAGLVLSGTEAQRTLQVRFAPGAEGVTTITLRVVDAAGAEATTQFRITVSQENTPPEITHLPDLTVREDAVIPPIEFLVADDETPARLLVVTSRSSNLELVPSSHLRLSGDSYERMLGITLPTNQFGTTTITLEVSDGRAMTRTNFLLTVLAVNDAPIISEIPDQAGLAGVMLGPVAFAVSDVETPAEHITVTARSSRPEILADTQIFLGTAGQDRTLMFLPSRESKGGETLITVTATDAEGLSTRRSFKVSFEVRDPAFRIERNGDSVILAWLSAARGYRLETAEDLQPGDWQVYTGPLTEVEDELQVTWDSRQGVRWFRLVRPAP